MPKYHNIETIPAKVFFEVLKTKNYQLLKPKPSEQDLESVFISIYDDYFVKSDNYEAKRYMTLTNEISFLEYKISAIKQTIWFITFNQTTEKMRIDLIRALRDGCGIDIDENQPFLSEMERVLQVEVGIIENDLNFAKIELKSMTDTSSKKDYDYYESIGVLSQILPNNSLLKENMSLAVYISLEKLANKIHKQEKNKKVA